MGLEQMLIMPRTSPRIIGSIMSVMARPFSGELGLLNAPDRGDIRPAPPGRRACAGRAVDRPSGRAHGRPARCPGR